MVQDLTQHHAAVTVNAPVQQVYGLFTHFNDFPKFMSFVKEVTYYDDQRSHWVAEVVGQHEWDAVNENWVPNQQIGWRSYNGLENAGRVTFQPVGSNQTRVDVFVNYNPPVGVLGDVGEKLGGGGTFDNKLQHDLDNFARMVDQAPPGALDPEASNYLFHGGSAAAKGTTTGRQDATMDDQYNTGGVPTAGDTYSTGTTYGQDVPYTGTGTVTDRPVLDQDIINEPLNTVPYPQDSGMRNPVMPPDANDPNPVMPPESGPAGTPDPVMPPERDTYSGH